MMAANKQAQQPETLVVGMGVTGLSCARFLSKRDMSLRLIDDRETPPLLDTFRNEFAESDIRLGRFDETALQGITTLLLSPGVSRQHPFVQLALQGSIEVIGDIELFARHINAPAIAITGSNGKSTVTTLVGELLEYAGKNVQVGGNLGTPALDLLQDPAPDFYVLELSSFQLESTRSLAPQAAVILNISADHMDRYADVDAYAASKARIYQHAGHVIFNKDDPAVAAIAKSYPGRCTAFTAHAPVNDEFGLVEKGDDVFLVRGDQLLIAAGELRLEGRHNWANALAALALIQSAGISPTEVLPALSRFAGLPHRCQWVAEHNRVRWINDSKATNIGAAKAAIGSMQGSIVLIAGGDGKGADFSELRETVEGKVKAAVLLGRDAPLLEAALRDVTTCVRVENMRAAVEQAAGLAKPGDTVLLAPACASLDMYSGYAARGDDFSRCVQQLIERLTGEAGS